MTAIDKSDIFYPNISVTFGYEDENQQILSSISTTSTVEFPSNIVRIKDATYSNNILSQPLGNCRLTLQNITFAANAKIADLGIATFQNFAKLSIVDLSNCNLLKSINYNCFAYSSLKKILLPMNGILTDFRSGSFAYSQIESIDIPRSLTKIEGYNASLNAGTFSQCQKLTNIQIVENSNLQYVGWSFAQGSSLQSFYIPEFCGIDPGALNSIVTMTSITLHPNNTKYKLYKGLLYTYDYSQLVQCPCGYPEVIEFHPDCRTLLFNSLRTYVPNILFIPAYITDIAIGSLYQSICPQIIIENSPSRSEFPGGFFGITSEIILPKSLKVAKSMSFDNYYGKFVEFYSKLQIIESNAFVDCLFLEYVKFNTIDQNLIIKENAFNRCPNLKMIILPATSAALISFVSNTFVDCPMMRKISYYWPLSSIPSHFNNGRKNNISDVTIFSFDNSTCGKIDISVNSADHCKIYKHCSNEMHYSSMNIFQLTPFISL